jgi:hypothetical protein
LVRVGRHRCFCHVVVMFTPRGSNQI